MTATNTPSPRACRPSRPAPRARAFTLLEILVSVGVMAILAAGISSVFVLASRALPSARGHSEASVSATATLDQLAADLRGATSVSETTPTSITFKVPDRNADTAEETIRYHWAGPGSPILRDYNAEQNGVILASAQSFNLAYTRRVEVRSTSGTAEQDSGPNVLLSSFNAWSGVTASNATATINTTAWASQAFPIQAAFPADTVRWYVSRVSIRVSKALLTDPTIRVTIHRPLATGNPVAGAQVGTHGSINTGLLGTFPGWQDATFNDVLLTDPGINALVMVMKGTSGGGQMEYQTSTSAPVDAFTFLWSTDSGGVWQPASNRQRNDAKFFVYGGYVRNVTTTVNANVYLLGSVTVTLQPSADAATRVDSGIALLNQPQAPAPSP